MALLRLAGCKLSDAPRMMLNLPYHPCGSGRPSEAGGLTFPCRSHDLEPFDAAWRCPANSMISEIQWMGKARPGFRKPLARLRRFTLATDKGR